MIGVMKWQDWTGFALGLWLAVSPWVLGYAALTEATANAAVIGLALAVVSLLEVGLSERADGWLGIAAGLWLAASPFALGFSAHLPAAINAAAVGTLVALAAAWALAREKGLARWWHEHSAGH